MICAKLILIGSLLTLSVLADDLPKWIIPCSRTDPKISDCIKENLQNVFSSAKEGFPDRKVETFDPLFIEEASTPDSAGAVALKLNFSNFTYSGISGLIVKEAKANFDQKCQIKAKSLQPKVATKGDYKADGRLLLFQVKGFGKFEILVNNMEVNAILNCEFYDKDNEKYLRITNVRFQIRPESGRLSFPNIVQNNSELSDTVNSVLNENFKEMLMEFAPVIQGKLEEKFTVLANRIVDNIPAKNLFKKD